MTTGCSISLSDTDDSGTPQNGNISVAVSPTPNHRMIRDIVLTAEILLTRMSINQYRLNSWELVYSNRRPRLGCLFVLILFVLSCLYKHLGSYWEEWLPWLMKLHPPTYLLTSWGASPSITLQLIHRWGALLPSSLVAATNGFVTGFFMYL